MFIMSCSSNLFILTNPFPNLEKNNKTCHLIKTDTY